MLTSLIEVGTVSTVAAGPKKRGARTRRRGRGRGRGGRRRSKSRRVVKRTPDEVEAELAAAAEGSGVAVRDMIKEDGAADAAAGPDVETLSVGPKRSKSRRVRRGNSRRRNASDGGSPTQRRRRRRKKKGEESGNEIAQQLQDSAITIDSGSMMEL
jgi:hypothetical protein